jgi:hypothetical protein
LDLHGENPPHVGSFDGIDPSLCDHLEPLTLVSIDPWRRSLPAGTSPSLVASCAVVSVRSLRNACTIGSRNK